MTQRVFPKHDRLLECEGKTRYQSRRAALTGKRLLATKGELVHPYFCKFCASWHVGHGEI